jgi:hypothetical protein
MNIPIVAIVVACYNKLEAHLIYGLNKAAQNIRLASINNGMGMNDVQIKAVFERYDLYKVLK